MKQQAIKQHYITEFINSGMSQQEAEETINSMIETKTIDENGWTEISEEFFGFEFCDKKVEYLDFDSSNKWRPISLRGIENNNSWTRIESKKDLPPYGETLYEVCVDGINQEVVISGALINFNKCKYSHFKKFEYSKNPLF